MASVTLKFVKVSATFQDGTASVLFKATTKQGGVHNIWHTVDTSVYKEGNDYVLDTTIEKIVLRKGSDDKTRSVIALRGE